MGRVVLFCSSDKTDQVRAFVNAAVGENSTVIVHPTEPPRMLVKVDCKCDGTCDCRCDLCQKDDCPSRNGNHRDEDRVPRYVGSGSKLIVLKVEVYEEIKNNSTNGSLKEIEIHCMKKRKDHGNNDEIKEKYRCYSATVGCYKNIKNKDILITAAHTIDDMKGPLVFLSEVQQNDKIVTKEIGRSSLGFYSAKQGLDILVISTTEEIQDHLENSIRSKCTSEYLPIEPIFTDPSFKVDVSLRGARSGNLNGRVCTKGPLRRVTFCNTPEGLKYDVIDAFAISSVVNESPLAQEGDSGAVTFKSVSKETRGDKNSVEAYGLVSCKANVVNDIRGRIVPEVVCVKAVKNVEMCVSVADINGLWRGD